MAHTIEFDPSQKAILVGDAGTPQLKITAYGDAFVAEDAGPVRGVQAPAKMVKYSRLRLVKLLIDQGFHPGLVQRAISHLESTVTPLSESP